MHLPCLGILTSIEASNFALRDTPNDILVRQPHLVELALCVVARNIDRKRAECDQGQAITLEIAVSLNCGEWNGKFITVWTHPGRSGFVRVKLPTADKSLVEDLLRRSLQGMAPETLRVGHDADYFGLTAVMPPFSRHQAVRLAAISQQDVGDALRSAA
jgi:hypothetical protein